MENTKPMLTDAQMVEKLHGEVHLVENELSKRVSDLRNPAPGAESKARAHVGRAGDACPAVMSHTSTSTKTAVAGTTTSTITSACSKSPKKDGAVKVRKPRGKYKTKKQPPKLTKPKRALSAYNYFFRYERAKLLGCEPPTIDDDAFATGSSDDSSGSEQGGLGNHLYTVTKRRPHRKTHGQIGFTDLAKHIGQIWKQLDSESRSFYEELAAKDLTRYRRDLATYKRLVAASTNAKMGAVEAGVSVAAINKAGEKRKEVSVAKKAGQKASLRTTATPTALTVARNSSTIAYTLPVMAAKPDSVQSSNSVRKLDSLKKVQDTKGATINVGKPQVSMEKNRTSNRFEQQQQQQHTKEEKSEQQSPVSSVEKVEPFPVISLSAPECDPLGLFGGPLEPLFAVVEDTASSQCCPPVTGSSSDVEPMIVESTAAFHILPDVPLSSGENKCWSQQFGEFDFTTGDALVDYLCNMP